MDRKQFLKAGLCSGVLTVLGQDSAPAAAETPCEKKQQFAEQWIKRFMDAADQELDPAARTRLMEANGRACYRGSHPKAPAAPGEEALARFMAAFEKSGFGSIRREGDTIDFSFSPGRCYCPLVESRPEGLSATYCQCSIGYVKANFGALLGKEPKVELLQSVLRGGQQCRFKIEV